MYQIVIKVKMIWPTEEKEKINLLGFWPQTDPTEFMK